MNITNVDPSRLAGAIVRAAGVKQIYSAFTFTLTVVALESLQKAQRELHKHTLQEALQTSGFEHFKNKHKYRNHDESLAYFSHFVDDIFNWLATVDYCEFRRVCDVNHQNPLAIATPPEPPTQLTRTSVMTRGLRALKAIRHTFTESYFDSIAYTAAVLAPASLAWWLMHHTGDVSWLKFVLGFASVFISLHGLFTCSIVGLLTGVFAALGSSLMVLTDRYQWIELAVMALITLTTMMWWTERFSWTIQDKYKDLATAEQLELESAENQRRETLNPRCKTCHAKSICPYQPGAVFDRYSRKQVNSLQAQSIDNHIDTAA